MFITLALAAANLDTELVALEHTVAAVTPATCAADLDRAFARLAAIDPAQVGPDQAFMADRLWQIRLDLHEQLIAFHAAGPVDEACITGFRRMDIATRYATDHVLMMDADAASWMTTAELSGPADLRSGDILVTRATALSSAGIAHIGAVDSTFSHNAMVHIDAQGQVWTVEAYLERGALVQPLDTFLTHGLGRIVVLRYEDPTLAATAAAAAFHRVAHGPAIDYDEAFDDTDHGEQLFCSEIGPWAFARVGGPTDLPLHPSRFPRDVNPALFDALAIPGDTIAAPADLLFDPRFRIVGEWRDLDQLETMRRHDAVVESLFSWMEADGYRLEARWSHRATVDVGMAVRRTPLLGRLVADQVHPHGDKDFLVGGLALQDAGQRLWDAAQPALANEVHPSRERLLAIFDEVRRDDLATWTAHPRQAGMHRVLHPLMDAAR